MRFAKLLAVGASLVATALAQSKLAFTTLPTAVEAGVPTTVKWAGGNTDAPVKITLRKGDPNDLKDVDVLTTTATGGSFTWTPSKSLPNGDDYALQITQGTEINFTGQIKLSGGSGTSASASVTKSSAASVTGSSSASVTSAATTVSLTTSQRSVVVVTSRLPLNATIPVAGTGVSFGTGASVGTSGIPITRNATLSLATLTTSNTRSAVTSTVGGASSSAGSGSGGAGGAGGSSAGSSATGAPRSGGATHLASPLALVLGAWAAIVYLG